MKEENSKILSSIETKKGKAKGITNSPKDQEPG
jgi:hypothetical protein